MKFARTKEYPSGCNFLFTKPDLFLWIRTFSKPKDHYWTIAAFIVDY